MRLRAEGGIFAFVNAGQPRVSYENGNPISQPKGECKDE